MDIQKDIIQDQKETIHRLQEECKEKTDIIMALEQKAFIKNPVEAYEKLLKENAELKARLQTLDDEVLTVEITPDEFERYKKYKRILEEIREIAKENIKEKVHNPDIDIILNKINEVLGNENNSK